MSCAHELVLFTAAYPYGTSSEPFLEAEIEVLAQRFRAIYLLPTHRQEGMRPLPENAELVEMDWLNDSAPAVRKRALASREAAWVLRSTLRRRPT